MNANEKPSEKPSEKAAMAVTNLLHIEGKKTFTTIKMIIARETSCDSLASENARLRSALEKIVSEWKKGETVGTLASIAM